VLEGDVMDADAEGRRDPARREHAAHGECEGEGFGAVAAAVGEGEERDPEGRTTLAHQPVGSGGDPEVVECDRAGDGGRDRGLAQAVARALEDEARDEDPELLAIGAPGREGEAHRHHRTADERGLPLPPLLAYTAA